MTAPPPLRAADPAGADGAAGPAPLSGRGRALHGAVFAVTALTAVTQFVLTGTGPFDPSSPDPGTIPSMVRFFSFFTIQSTILVAVTSLLLAMGRPLTLGLRVLRVDSLVAIVITAVVHWFLLRPLGTEPGIIGVLDTLLHVVGPALAVLAWILAGPRTAVGAPRGLGLRVTAWALVFPVLFGAWTFLHGAVTHWYPYPFIDVPTVGYGPAVAMALGVLAAFVVLAAGLEGIERAVAQVISARRARRDGT
ncbi:Pr6Pr family membrane protein [Brachybacterium phenoliresistens]|uniref:Pr6Pr family membrane protein n=1 Tax=Brachybacterium phenoliresistens TaxID=396014 RepID=UPI0031DEB9F6